jgi:ATP phosphoribosyltransferase
MLNVALPKGRLGDQVYALFSKIGYDCGAIYEGDRRLVLESPENDVRYLLVKPSDVAIYVEYGAADIGVVGKDILLDGNPDVYELLDLGIGKCRICVAGPEDYVEDRETVLRVATKFTTVAKKYYSSLNREIEIIKLNGSIELAPILGLSDVIVDIVETGTTLRENDLTERETIVPISARLIANKASYKFQNAAISQIVRSMETQLEETT